MEDKKKRTNYLYEKIGRINSKKKRTSKAYPDSYYYQLNVNIENDTRVEKIFVFPNTLASEAVWKAIENSEYIDKRYLFFCHNNKGNYRVINWKELKDHGSN